MKKALSLLLVIAILATSVVTFSASAASSLTFAKKVIVPDNKQSYPLKKNVTLSFLVDFAVGVDGDKANFPFEKELEKRTGVKMNYIYASPVGNGVKEKFMLLAASGDLPDIYKFGLGGYPGGPEAAIANKVVLKLNDLLPKYAPNLTELYKKNPHIDKLVKTDSGNYYAFPFIRSDVALQVYQGPMVRRDWLQELKLQAPRTISEWENMLTAFKDKKGVKAPLCLSLDNLIGSGVFVGAYKTYIGLYVDDGVVKYGPVDKQFKDFLTLISSWYKKGFLDEKLPTMNGNDMTLAMTTGKSGAIVANVAGGMGAYMKMMSTKDPKFNLEATYYPTLKRGEKAMMSQYDMPVTSLEWAISPTCKDIESAIRWFDFGYSKDGMLFSNFGTPGVSYNMVNNSPKYTKEITNNPKGRPMSEMLGLHTRVSWMPSVQMKEYLYQYCPLPNQKNALTLWPRTDAVNHKMPPTTYTPEESKAVAQIDTDINTYMKEMLLKFIFGVEPISNFDSYVNKLKSLGLDTYLKYNQKAYDRFMKR